MKDRLTPLQRTYIEIGRFYVRAVLMEQQGKLRRKGDWEKTTSRKSRNRRSYPQLIPAISTAIPVFV